MGNATAPAEWSLVWLFAYRPTCYLVSSLLRNCILTPMEVLVQAFLLVLPTRFKVEKKHNDSYNHIIFTVCGGKGEREAAPVWANDTLAFLFSNLLFISDDGNNKNKNVRCTNWAMTICQVYSKCCPFIRSLHKQRWTVCHMQDVVGTAEGLTDALSVLLEPTL